MAHLQQTKEDMLLTGSVAEKNDYLYWVINYYVEGKRKQKWVPTHMKVKGNKTKAKNMLLDVRREWTLKFGVKSIDSKSSLAPEPQIVGELPGKVNADVAFLDWLYIWLKHKYKQATQQTLDDKQIDIVTYAGYANNLVNPIAPYFRQHSFTLGTITKDDIKAFYTEQLKRVKVTTAKHYHSVIHGAFNYAIDEGLLAANPADRISFPKQPKFKGKYYHHEEAMRLFEVMQGVKIELPILLASFYGMRRSEVLGLKWDAFDFTYDNFTIKHTVTQYSLEGKTRIHKKDKTKTQSSLRTYPLIPYIKARLLDIRAKQEEYKKLCGRSYDQEYIGYLCVDQIGELLKPGYVTSAFPKLLKKNDLRHIRFHDLRHTCAAILLANGIRMEQIQEWLGHSEIGTTSDIYGHLEFITKIASAKQMEQVFNMTMTPVDVLEKTKAANPKMTAFAMAEWVGFEPTVP